METKSHGEQRLMVHRRQLLFLIRLRFNTQRTTIAVEISTSVRITTIHSHLMWLQPSIITRQFLQVLRLQYNLEEAPQACAAVDSQRLDKVD